MPLNLQKPSLFIWLISAPFIIKPGWPTHLSPSLQKCPLSFWWCCDCPLHGCLCQTWHTASTLWWESPANSWLITAPHLNEWELKTQKPSLQSYFVSALKIFYCRIYPHFASFYLIRQIMSFNEMCGIMKYSGIVLVRTEAMTVQKTIERSDTLVYLNVLKTSSLLCTVLCGIIVHLPWL